MDLNPNMEIKKEKLSLVEKLCFDDESYLDFELDLINPKVENVVPEEDDWCGEEYLSSALHQTSISYEELLEDQKQTCFICSNFFPNSFLLLQHNMKHLNVPLINRKVFSCDHCLMFFTKKSDLELHIHANHWFKKKRYSKNKVDKLYNCSLCRRRNMSYKAWHEHVNNVHAKDRMKCDLCLQSFKCKRYLKRHILYIHQGARPDWRFRKKQGSVTKTSKVKCPLCPGVYSDKHALKTHTRNCHSDKKFKCEVCNSELKSRSYLLAHMLRVHYNDGHEHCCETCHKKFRSPRYLNIHINNVHIKHKSVLKNK